LIGAAAYCHLRLDAHNVDPVHARVAASDTYGLSLADAGSSTGTYVNGRRIAGRYPLKDGDLVSLGPPGASQSASLRVRLPPVEKIARDPTPPPAPRGGSGGIDTGRAQAPALIPPPPGTPPRPRGAPPPRPPEPAAPSPRRRRRGGRRSMAGLISGGAEATRTVGFFTLRFVE
jgi:pSer/pThr/pTyr-binding forkhead associated (FHA) protein